MKTFQKIKSFDNEKAFETKLRDEEKPVDTFFKDDYVMVTEKIDGANASVRVIDGELHCYSHRRELSSSNTLNGFYGFVEDHVNEFMKLPENLILFGEWLIPHTIKYKEEAYKKFYLFDVFNLTTNKYEGFLRTMRLHEALFESKDIKLVPLLFNGNGLELDDLTDVQSKFAYKSDISLNSEMEGIVVSDLNKKVQIGNSDEYGPLRIKLVNQQFKETKKSLKTPPTTEEKAMYAWLTKNVTTPRIRKRVFALQEDGELDGEMEFSWLQNGNAAKVSESVLDDAVEESVDLPAFEGKMLLEFSKFKKIANMFTRKETNKFIAMSVKGLI